MNRLSEISRYVREYSTEGHGVTLAVIVALAIFALFVYLYRRLAAVWEQRRRIEKMFADLVVASELTDAERDLLLDMAEFYSLHNPGVLFVAPSLVVGYAGNRENREPEGDSARLAARVTAVADKLFGPQRPH